MENFLDFLDNLFTPKDYWRFYAPVGFGDKKYIETIKMTGRQAFNYARINHYLFEIAL